MIDKRLYKENIDYSNTVENKSGFFCTNPLALKTNFSKLNAVSNYSQVFPKPEVDRDVIDILYKVEEMNSISPAKLFLPYSYILDEINGERIFNKDGSLAMIVEYESDLIREYYPDEINIFVKMILEKNKNGELISKIEPNFTTANNIKINIIIFDSKVNNKYTMFHLEENDKIVSITEFFEQSNNFRTLFRNPLNSVPERYIESRENYRGELELLDCKLNPTVQEIRRIIDDREIIIRYEGNKKIVDVRRKTPG